MEATPIKVYKWKENKDFMGYNLTHVCMNARLHPHYHMHTTPNTCTHGHSCCDKHTHTLLHIAKCIKEKNKHKLLCTEHVTNWIPPSPPITDYITLNCDWWRVMYKLADLQRRTQYCHDHHYPLKWNKKLMSTALFTTVLVWERCLQTHWLCYVLVACPRSDNWTMKTELVDEYLFFLQVNINFAH